MIETNTAGANEAQSRGLDARALILMILPLLLLGALLALLVTRGTGLAERSAPPIEEVTINRVSLPARDMVSIEVTNGGADPVTIAQVLVDDAYWEFTITPANTIPRLGTATLNINFPWQQDEPHAILLISSNGVTFPAEVAVATLTPAPTLATFWQYALLGIYVGFIPVGLGMLWFPALRRMGKQGMQFILALTVGLLLYLLFGSIVEAREFILETPAAFGGEPIVILTAILTFLLLIAVSMRKPDNEQSRLGISTRIALGIGLHNLGEGLAIGAAFANGQAALGTFLVVGFTLHNITEGIGIVTPMVRESPPLWRFIALAALAGLPAVLGVWIGGFVFSKLAAALFLAIGAGAIAQVVYEVGRLLTLQSTREHMPLVSWPTFAGIAIGVGIMALTALSVPA